VLILGDGILGQMMEAVELPEQKSSACLPEKPWAITGAKGRSPQVVHSLYLDPEKLEHHNLRLQAKYDRIVKHETMAESYLTEDAEIILVGYGSTARIAKAAVDQARKAGIKAGLFRPITLFPFPKKEIMAACAEASQVLTVEMSLGQLIEDVRYNLEFKIPVHFYGRVGGMVPTMRAVLTEIQRLVQEGGAL
jgi:2-oxoglutarate ferredoxin oxidoreductase subunit alpha